MEYKLISKHSLLAVALHNSHHEFSTELIIAHN